MWSIFQHDAKQHEIQRAVVNLDPERLFENYIGTSCPPQEELQTWSTNLKENVGVTDERLKAGVRDRYRKAIIPFKTTKGFDRWITLEGRKMVD